MQNSVFYNPKFGFTVKFWFRTSNSSKSGFFPSLVRILYYGRMRYRSCKRISKSFAFDLFFSFLLLISFRFSSTCENKKTRRNSFICNVIDSICWTYILRSMTINNNLTVEKNDICIFDFNTEYNVRTWFLYAIQ